MIFNNAITLFKIVLLLINVLNATDGMWLNFFLYISILLTLLPEHLVCDKHSYLSKPVVMPPACLLPTAIKN